LVVAQCRVGQVQLLVFVLAGAQQLACADAQLAEQRLEFGRAGRSFQVADDLGLDAAFLEQFEGAAGFGAARIMKK